MAVCSDKKYNSYRSANLFFFFLWNKLWKKTLNFGSFTWEIKEPSLYWNNSWLQHPLWSKRSAVFELLIVQFRLAFSEDFQVFHLEEMPLAPFSLFFFFLPGSIFFINQHKYPAFWFESFSYFIFILRKQLHHMQKKISSINIYSAVVVSNGCELRCNLVSVYQD